MTTRRKVAAGNWKMNGVSASLAEVDALVSAVKNPSCDVILCPPATLIPALVGKTAGGSIKVGGQDCHWDDAGAHTGDISAPMLRDAGADFVIVGHSERRADHGETDAIVRSKAEAAWRAGLTAIICVGETGAQRDAGKALDIIRAQLGQSVPDGCVAENTIIAYEPVWAIGTGRTPSLADIAEMHAFMRERLALSLGSNIADGLRLLYGGSVKPGNAAEIFAVPDVDGALVGGASLRAADFGPIIAAAAAA